MYRLGQNECFKKFVTPKLFISFSGAQELFFMSLRLNILCTISVKPHYTKMRINLSNDIHNFCVCFVKIHNQCQFCIYACKEYLTTEPVINTYSMLFCAKTLLFGFSVRHIAVCHLLLKLFTIKNNPVF